MVLRVELGPEEGNRIRRLSRSTRSVVTLKRCLIVLHSAQGFTPPHIAGMLGLHPNYVRTVIKAYRSDGREALDPKYGGGRPRVFTEDQRRALENLATSRPADLGLPFQEWSLPRLRREAVRRSIVPDISTSWLAVLLHDAALSYQEAKTWKVSTDPRFEEKKKRIEGLLRRKHNPPAVVAADEMGPLSLVPRKGRGWHPVGGPHRIPATYHKTQGVRYWFGAYHVGGNRLWGRLERRKGGKPWLRHLKSIRKRFPREQRVYVIQDNLSAHTTPDVESWARENSVFLVPTPTNASWLNPIECRFTEVQSLALDGSNHPSWGEAGRALRRGAAYRNTHRVRGVSKVTRPLWKRH